MRIMRLVELTWDRDTDRTSHKFTAAFRLSLLPRLVQERDGWILCLPFVRLHRRTAWGGRFA